MDLDDLATQILQEAAAIGGQTWTKIKKSSPLYVRAYVRSLADIAAGLAAGEINKKDAAMFVRNAQLLLVMGIANTSHVVLVQVQALFEAVVDTLKTSINAALPIPVLS